MYIGETRMLAIHESMSLDRIDWDLYRTFAAVVQEGSLSGAARLLGLTQPTVGRHVEALESALGVALFTRATRGLAPTDAALGLLPHAQAMEAAAAALVRSASGQAEEPVGAVRVSASDIIGCEVLPAVLRRFRDRYPRVTLELVTSNRMTNLLTREADIAVRMVRPEQGTLVARRLGSVHVGLYAHRRYAERHGLPRNVEAAREHSAVGFDTDTRSLGSVRVSGIELDREMFDFRSDNMVAQLAAVRSGLGIGAVQKPLADRDPELVPVLAESVVFSMDMWLAMHRDLRGVRRMRVLFDHLAAELSAYCNSGNPEALPNHD
jgi:DNA-binding transcriptional LysR family regulator